MVLQPFLPERKYPEELSDFFFLQGDGTLVWNTGLSLFAPPLVLFFLGFSFKSSNIMAIFAFRTFGSRQQL